MKNKKEFLSHISRHRPEYTWVAIFLFFLAMAAMHATFFASIVISCVSTIPLMLLSWLLRKVLIPRFLHQQSWIYYMHGFFAIAILSFIFSTIEGFMYGFLFRNNLVEVSENMEQTINAGANIGHVYLTAKALLLLTITLAVVTVSHLLEERKQSEQAAKEMQMQLELKYLRAQVNPHFLFNALNCIYSLTLIKDDQASDSVLKLSEMLRFVIDDCRADHVPISKEYAYIINYIDFQKIRMEHKPDISVECNIEDPSFGIPPMIFQPMVENCFKHSRIVDDRNAFIRISLIQRNGHVLFSTTNTKHCNHYNQEDEERTGIGVQNVRQRLDLLFDQNYSLEIKEDETLYKIELKF